MRHTDELETRLREWGDELGGGQYENTGWQGRSPLASAIMYQGPAPQGLAPITTKDRTPAYEVFEAVRALKRQPHGFGAACVLEAHYLTPGSPFESKQKRLAQIGVQISSKVRYSQLLRIGRMHVASWLRIAYSEEQSDAA